MNAQSPRVEIGPIGPDLGAGDAQALLLLVGAWSRAVPHRAVRAFLGGLIEAGRDFAETPEGARWRAVLIESQWAHKGWQLWNMIEMDDVVAAVPAKPDPAAAAIENLAAAIRAAVESPAQRDRPVRFTSTQGVAGAEAAYHDRNAFLDFALGLAAVAERTVTSLSTPAESVPRLPAEPVAMNGSILR